MTKDKNWHGVLDELYDAGKPQTQAPDTNTTHIHRTQTQQSNTTNIHNTDAIPARAFKQKEERRNQRVQLLFKPATYQKLTELAHSTGISLNNLVNSILEDHIEQHNL